MVPLEYDHNTITLQIHKVHLKMSQMGPFCKIYCVQKPSLCNLTCRLHQGKWPVSVWLSVFSISDICCKSLYENIYVCWETVDQRHFSDWQELSVLKVQVTMSTLLTWLWRPAGVHFAGSALLPPSIGAIMAGLDTTASSAWKLRTAVWSTLNGWKLSRAMSKSQASRMVKSVNDLLLVVTWFWNSFL